MLTFQPLTLETWPGLHPPNYPISYGLCCFNCSKTLLLLQQKSITVLSDLKDNNLNTYEG